MKSWKIGAVAGLIAGIVAGILGIFMIIFVLRIGLGAWGLEVLSFLPIEKIAFVEITGSLIFSIILGIIYSKFYETIPSKGVTKGLVFGLIYYSIYCIRLFTVNLIYWAPWYALSWLVMIVIYIPFGLALGISYEFLNSEYISKKGKAVTIKYDLKSGIHPGAIAGLIGGFSAFLIQLLVTNKSLYPMITADLMFLVGQLGSHGLFNLIWGIIFGILFVMFYDKIPGNGILKGFIYSMILYFLTSFRLGFYALMYLMYGSYDYGVALFIVGFFAFFPFGLVIGCLYKPSK